MSDDTILFEDDAEPPPPPPIKIIKRREWGEDNAKPLEPIWHPVPYVVLETNTGVDSCFTRQECTKAVRELQRRDMKELGEPQIQYNFLIGEDGNVYEGRGWDFKPARLKAPSEIIHRFDIAFIGRHSTDPPNMALFEATKTFLRLLKEKTFIKDDFTLVEVKPDNSISKIFIDV